MKFTWFLDSDPLQLKGHDYRFGDAQRNNYLQIMKAAPVVALIGDESCVDVCDSDARCETCRDAYVYTPMGDSRCQYYKDQHCTKPRPENYQEEACRKTCGTCTSTGKPCIATIVSSAILLLEFTDDTDDCKWSPWSAWEACTVSCGGEGTQRSHRWVTREAVGNGKPCTGEESRTRTCSTEACPGRFACPCLTKSFFLPHY